ncbi:MAG: TetR/AcrR family transcriptional regulator [Kofleriaceae bacterium]
MPVLRKKRAYHHGDLRASLVEATLAIIDHDGVEAVSLSQAARRLGVSPQAVYNHFDDKSALLAACAEHVLLALDVHSQALVGTPNERLEQLGIKYVEFAVAHPKRFALLGVVRSTQPTLLTAVKKLIDECIAAKLIHGKHAESLAQVAFAMVHGVAWLAIDEHQDHDAAVRSAKLAMRTLWRGLGV